MSHIWTQSKSETQKIAEATYIKNQCKHWSEMLDQIDALLLARDDSQNHMKYAELFLKRGIPVYIDKPLATSIKPMNIYLQKYQDKYSHAARYDMQMNHLDESTRTEIGVVKRIEATSIKDWDKYAVHIIEPSYNIANPKGDVLEKRLNKNSGKTRLELFYSNIELLFETTGEITGEIAITIIGSEKTIVRKFKDPFHAFKKTLEIFVEGVRKKKQMIPTDEVRRVVSIIELGKQQVESQRDEDNSGNQYL